MYEYVYEDDESTEDAGKSFPVGSIPLNTWDNEVLEDKGKPRKSIYSYRKRGWSQCSVSCGIGKLSSLNLRYATFSNLVTLTFDLGNRTHPRYWRCTSLCQILCPYVKWFSWESEHTRTDIPTELHSAPSSCLSLVNVQVSVQRYIRRHSVYCLVDELRQGSFCPRRRKKNKK